MKRERQKQKIKERITSGMKRNEKVVSGTENKGNKSVSN
jgi:hypothetical protein